MSYFPERRHPRYEFQRFPWVLTLRMGAPSWSDKPTRIEGKNICQGGTKFFANRRFQLFESLNVSIFEKGSGKALANLMGKVVRVEEIDTGFGERTYGIAIEFLSDTTAFGALFPKETPAPGQ